MFRSILVVLLFVQCAMARTSHHRSTGTSCEVSAWSAWGECVCTTSTHTTAASYSIQEEVHDTGRQVMQQLRLEKEAEWEQHQQAKTNQPSGRVNCEDGYAGRMPCRNVDQISFVNFEKLGKTPGIRQKDFGNDMWGWTDPQTDDEYAIMCTFAGTSFVRVTDAENPLVVGYLPSRTNTTTYWHDVKVVNDHAYIVSEADDDGMQVFDMTRLRHRTSYSVLTSDAEYLEVGSSHNLVMNQETQTVFIVGATQSGYNNCEGGLHMVDVSVPKEPRFAGCYSTDGYTHDAQCIIYRGPDAKYQGREICFSYNENSLTIVDVTDRSHPMMVSKYCYVDYCYTHQGWLTEDQSVLLLDDELDEKENFQDKRTRTHVWDITSLDEPELKSTFISLKTSIDHNQYIKGQFTYQSNYAAGLRILHINQETYSLNEVAYFDVLPEVTMTQFRGSWSNYPYFKSGNIAVSSIDYGLFMVRPHYETMEQQSLQNVVTGHQSRVRSIVSATNPDTCPNLQEYQACDPPSC